jgi:hypothetical protein
VNRLRTLILLCAGSVVVTACRPSLVDDFGPELVVHNTSTETVYVQANPNSTSAVIVVPPGAIGGSVFVATGYVLSVIDTSCRRIGTATVPAAKALVLLTIGRSLEIREVRPDELPEDLPALTATDKCAAGVSVSSQ